MTGAPTRRVRTRAPSAGFTLIEVMVAFAILGILSAMIWGGFAQTVNNKKRIEEISDRQHAIRMALDRMQRELSMAFVSVHRSISVAETPPLTAFIAKDRSGGDRVDFSSFANRRLYRNAKESDQCEIGYFLARNPRDPDDKVIARRHQNRIDAEPEEGGRTEIILEGVRELELEYLDPVSKEWVNTWDTTQAAGQPNRLPTQVKIYVTVPDPQNPDKDRTYGTRAILPMTWALNHAAYN